MAINEVRKVLKKKLRFRASPNTIVLMNYLRVFWTWPSHAVSFFQKNRREFFVSVCYATATPPTRLCRFCLARVMMFNYMVPGKI